MKKNKRLLPLLLCILLLTSCGSAGNTDEPLPEEGELEVNYQKLEAAIASFRQSDSGVLDLDIDYSQKYIDVTGQEDTEYSTKTLHNISFRKNGQSYDFLQRVQQEEQGLSEGFLQIDGVRTKYTYKAYDDGTFEWQQGPAMLNQQALPEEVEIFFDLPGIGEIDAIASKSASDQTEYTLTMDEAFFDTATRDSQYSEYELQTYNLSYFVDKDGNFAGAVLTNKEAWDHSEIYNVEQTHRYELGLSKKNEAVDMDYFQTSGTHVKTQYTAITEIWREEYINIPESYIFDVRVPKLKENLPNAYKINLKIENDCNMELYATEEDLISEGEWGGYPWHTTDFAVYQFGDIYEICIFNSEASAWGSGVGMWIYKYYYDQAAADEISADDFLAVMGYTPEQVVEIFYADYLGDISEGGMYTYEDISQWFYFDAEGNIQFYVNLFG